MDSFQPASPAIPLAPDGAACPGLGELERVVARTTSVALFFAVDGLRLVYLNDAFRRIAGFADGAGLGRDWTALVHPDDAGATVAAFEAAHAARSRFVAEYRMRRQDGEYRWIRTYGMPCFDAIGSYRGMTGCCLDITDLRLAREREAAARERFELAVAGSSEGIFDWPDLEDPRFWVSARTFELLGYAEGAFDTRLDTLLGMTHELDRPALVAALDGARRHGGDLDVEFRMRLANGRYNWFHARAVCVGEPGRGPRRLVGSFQDIDARISAMNQIQRIQDRFRVAIEASTYCLWDWEIPDDRVWFSASVQTLLGFAPGTDAQLDLDALNARVHPDDWASVKVASLRHLRAGEPYDIEFRLRHASGEYRWFRSRGQARRDERGRAVRMSGSMADVHQRKEAELALKAEREKALVTLASIGDAVVTTDAAGRIELLNTVAEKLLGTTQAAAVGRPLSEVVRIVRQETRVAVSDPVEACMRHGRVGSDGDSLLLADDGGEHAVEYTASPIRNDRGEVYGAVLVLRNVTQERRMAEAMSYQATHDGLTGLVNRVEFERRLQRVIRQAASGECHALCYLDLDQFKVINDTCGHGAGDELLRQVALLLQETVRRRDTVARLGGDEFGLLMEHCTLQQAARVANEVRERIANYRFHWEHHVFAIGASIGLVTIDETSEQMADIMRHVDAACYLAKEHGRNRIHVYDPGDQTLERRRGEMQWVSRINQALLVDSFELYVQPALALQASDAPRYVEVLLRYRDGQVLRSPAEFLPAAERYSLSPKIDSWVVRSLLDCHARAPHRFRPGTLFAINLSALSLCDEQFLDFLDSALARSAMPAELLCFEITETAAIGNLTRAVQFFNAMRARGCRFALDDFGSGLSSFGYLRTLPVDFLKIDGLFVRDCVEDPIDFAMVKSINEIGHVMGIRTIAEFAENGAIEARMREIGVDYVQGYGVSRPIPIEQFLGD